MKKFTNLEEELIKENAKLAEKFNIHYQEILQKLDTIKVKLDDIALEQTKDPKNWGFVGSIAHVHEYVDDILEFLGVPYSDRKGL